MLDISNLPPTQSMDVQIFTSPVSSNYTQWTTYEKPRGASMLYIFMMGAGAGGGGGFFGAGRGGGGGSGAQSVLFVPAFLLPDTLYIQVASGGAGGSGGGSSPAPTAGSAPTTSSIVSVEPSTAAAPTVTLLQSDNATFATGGAAATAGGAGSAGSGAGAATIANCALAGLGYFTFIPGQNGFGGSTSSTYPTTGDAVADAGLRCMGGGLSVTAATGSQNFFPAFSRGSSGGGYSFISWKPFYTTPAAAPPDNLSVNGPDAAFGCGGTGGSLPLSAASGGGGGKGGNGIVIIAAW